MNKPLGLALLIGGLLLVIVGLRSEDSFASSVSKLFTGSPTNRVLVMEIGGVAAAIAGIALLRRD